MFVGPLDVVWTGNEVVVAVGRVGPETVWTEWHAFDPATGRWRGLAPSPDAAGHLAWTGDLVLVVGGRDAAAYDPAADCWLEMPPVPLPELPENAMTARADEWAVPSVHWTGEELLAVVGRVESLGWTGVVSFDPTSWDWTPRSLGPLDGTLVDPILADGLLWFMSDTPNDAYGGRYTTNGTYDPATDTWAEIDAGCRVSTRRATWTGRLIMEPYFDRRAFDPDTGACYRTPASNDRARQWEPVWTGREFLYWSGAYGDTLRAFRDGVVYRPPRESITGEPAKPVSERLRNAIKARRRYGFDTDPDVVRQIMRDPWQPASRKFGFPMTAAEESEIWSRSGRSHRASAIQPWLRTLPTFGGVWLDQRGGGDVVIALTDADPVVIAEIDRFFTPYGETPWRLVIVPHTARELKRALWRVHAASKQLDPDATLWAAGVDQSAGLVSLMYDPDDVGRMRARKAKLEKALGVPVRITSGRVRDV